MASMQENEEAEQPVDVQVGIVDAYFAAWRRVFDYGGVSTRREFWVFVITHWFVLFPGIGFLLGARVIDLTWTMPGIIAFGHMAIAAVVSLPLMIRRVRDATATGWPVLVGLIPWVGILVVAIICLLPSQKRKTSGGNVVKVTPAEPTPYKEDDPWVRGAAGMREEEEVERPKRGHVSGPCSAWKRPFDFKGRATRTEFWCFVLGGFIVPLVIAVFGAMNYESGLQASAEDELNPFEIGFAVYWLIMWIPWLSVAVRRARDAAGTGWAGLVMLIPLGALIIGLIPSMKTQDES